MVYALADYSAYNPPSPYHLMGVLKAYLDDSGDPPDPNCMAFALAGHVASVEAWTQFESEWAALLVRHGLPHLHMREFADRRSPLYGLGEPAKSNLLSDCVAVMKRAGLYAIGAVIRLRDLEEFNAKRGRQLDAKSLALFSCLIELHHKYPGEKIELKLGIGSKPYGCFALAKEYADSYKHKVGRGVTFSPLADEDTLDNLLPMQAADFAVYETFKNAKRYDGFFTRKRIGAEEDDLAEYVHLKGWEQETFGDGDRYRKSFALLMKEAPIEGIIWDYDFMMRHDQFRRGVWSVASSE